MDSLLDFLVPRPRHAGLTEEPLMLPRRPTVSSPPSRAADRLLGLLRRFGFEARLAAGDTEATTIRLCLGEDASLGTEGYRLEVKADGAEVTAGSPQGLFYGAATLGQWLELHRDEQRRVPSRLSGISIRDTPSFAVRGVMLDVSRDKVPRMETLYELVDLFAGLKLNQLQLYTEHTFAYSAHELVWRDASPMTPDDVRKLEAFCAERFVELVANQQSFGHFHRWLVHEPFRALAECPEGFAHPFSLEPEPFSLCPLDPRVPKLLAGFYDELLPLFRSRLVNVGCDETLDLGLGRSRAACEERGREQVYVDFLNRVGSLLAERGKRMQFWGDIILNRPELIAQLPEDAVALEWGYEADHPFAEDSRRFAASGREFYVCPGTSSWNSFAGRTHNAVLNLASAAVHGTAHGASGYLVTDWGDFGHLQPLTASYPGFVTGAAFSWNAEAARAPLDLALPELLDRHVYRDRAGVAGRITTGLGNAYLQAGTAPTNGSALFFLVVFAFLEREGERIQGVTAENLGRTLEYLESTVSSLAETRLERGDSELVERELGWTADMLAFACRFGRARLESGDMTSLPALRTVHRRELESLIERHQESFLARNRPGGLERSSGWLRRVANLL